MNSRSVRHLAAAVLVTLLLLIFYFSISSDPLLQLLRPTARSPSILNIYGEIELTNKLAIYYIKFVFSI